MLAAIDLRELADELLGPHAGSDRSPTWPCPDAEHPQTGRTPPVTVFTARTGIQRWHCHGCGNGGTAIDLVMQVLAVDVRTALDKLAARARYPSGHHGPDGPASTGGSRAQRSDSRRSTDRPAPARNHRAAGPAQTHRHDTEAPDHSHLPEDTEPPGRADTGHAALSGGADSPGRTGLTAERLGAPLPPVDRPRRDPTRGSRYLDDYVSECAEALWSARGTPVRRWLTDARGLPEDLLRLHRVGADLGTRRQRRPDGVPRVRLAAVLPVLDGGRACFAQLRVLGASRAKYLNTSDTLAPNPRVGFYKPARTFDFPFERRGLIVTEGIIDALSAAAGGYRAAAVLSATYADPAAAARLRHEPDQLIVAFDPDPAGRAASERLVNLLKARNRPPGVMVLARGDLNDNLQRSGDWPVELAGRVQHAIHHPGLLPTRSYLPTLGGMQ